jgi:hypothetical protein
MNSCISPWRRESRVARQDRPSPARWHGLAPAIAAILLAVGCGRSDGLVPVGGTVKLDGVALSGALVEFHAEPGVRGNGGSAMTDAAGRFMLLSPQGRKGIFRGEYRITVSCRKPTAEAERQVAELAADGLTPALSNANFREALPAAYTNPDRTTLKQTIGAAGGTVDIDLDSTTAKKNPPQPRK